MMKRLIGATLLVVIPVFVMLIDVFFGVYTETPEQRKRRIYKSITSIFMVWVVIVSIVVFLGWLIWS